MRIRSFRIKNYKSIKDSGECRLGQDMTIFIGRNESGKTAVLEALRDFDRTVSRIPDDAYPIDYLGEDKPQIAICFEVSSSELDAFQRQAGVKLPSAIAGDILSRGLTICKDADGSYRLPVDDQDAGSFEPEPGRPVDRFATTELVQDEIQAILRSQGLPSFDFSIYLTSQGVRAPELVGAIKSILPSISDEDSAKNLLELVRTLIEEARAAESATGDARHSFLDVIVAAVPSFVFFSEFLDVLPFEVNLSELKNNAAVRDFAKIAGLDLDEVMNTADTQRRINLLSRYSAKIGGDFLTYWEQNRIELVARSEGGKILFGVKEHDRTELFKVSQRSKGFQWFLAFYLKLNAQKSKDMVILIDEPGMHLHGKAQRDILAVIEDKIASESQVLFSTHSPFLIDVNRLDRVRLITKGVEAGSVIENEVRRSTEHDALLPVETAMRKDMPHSLGMGGRYVILRGMSDYFYISAMQEYMYSAALKGINFIPSEDLSRLPAMISLLVGSNADFRVLLNTDKESRDLTRDLRNEFLLSDDQLIFVSRDDDMCLEDLFTPEDFKDFVLPAGLQPLAAPSNSRLLTEAGLNAALVARDFLEKIRANRQGVLSKETITAFKEVFERISGGFKDHNYTEKELQAENLIPKSI